MIIITKRIDTFERARCNEEQYEYEKEHEDEEVNETEFI